jgi:hypothetical protein
MNHFRINDEMMAHIYYYNFFLHVYIQLVAVHHCNLKTQNAIGQVVYIRLANTSFLAPCRPLIKVLYFIVK